MLLTDNSQFSPIIQQLQTGEGAKEQKVFFLWFAFNKYKNMCIHDYNQKKMHKLM